MPEGDVTVFYRLVPTQDSVRKAAEDITGSLNKSFQKTGFGKGFMKTLEAAQGAFAKTPIGKAAAAGAAGGGGVGGALAGIAGSLTALVGIGLVISAALLIVSAFFEAVGPIIKVMSKVLTAMMLILLMPFLRVLLPYLPKIIKALIGASQWLAGIFTVMINVVGKWLEAIWDSLVKVGGKLGSAFDALARGDIGGFFKDVLGAGAELLTGAMISMAGPILYGLATAIKENLPEIINAVSIVFEGASEVVKGLINAMGIAVFGEDAWSTIKADIKYLQESIFSEEGIWSKVKGAIDFIAEKVFGKDLWEKIKQAITDVNKMIDDEWQVIVKTLQDIGGLLMPIAAAFQGILNFINSWSFEPPRGGGGGGGGGGVGDFISRPGMAIQSFSPNDTIIGVKNPAALGGGGAVIHNHFNIDARVDKGELRRILSEFAREQGRNLRKKTSYTSGFYA